MFHSESDGVNLYIVTPVNTPGAAQRCPRLNPCLPNAAYFFGTVIFSSPKSVAAPALISTSMVSFFW